MALREQSEDASTPRVPEHDDGAGASAAMEDVREQLDVRLPIDEHLEALETTYRQSGQSSVEVRCVRPSVYRGGVRPISDEELRHEAFESLEGKAVVVSTNTGLVIEGGRHELATAGMIGCGVLYIQGPKEGMLHLTPAAFAELGFRRGGERYSPADLAVRKLASSVADDLSQYSVVIAMNAGDRDPGSTFHQDVLTEDMQNMKDLLVARGMLPENIRIEQIPVANSLALHSQEEPGVLFFMGIRTRVDEHGKEKEDSGQIDTYAIPLRGGEPARLYRTNRVELEPRPSANDR